MIAAFIDGVKASPEFFVKTSFARFIISLGEKYLPFFTIGMGWIIPALIGFIIGLIVFKVRGTIIQYGAIMELHFPKGH